MSEAATPAAALDLKTAYQAALAYDAELLAAKASQEETAAGVPMAEAIGAFIVSAALIALLKLTLLGKAVRALMQSPTGAQLVGINTRRLHPLMFGIGLGLSGVAGCLLSMAYTIAPSMGEPYTVTALIVITLGGFGSLAGSLAGGLLLFSNNYRRFRLDEAAVAQFADCREISPETIGEDFQRNPRIHRCWELCRA